MNAPISLEVPPTRDGFRAGMARLYELGLAQVLGNDPQRVDSDTGEFVARRYVIQFAELHIPMTVRQRGFLHAAVFPQIAEQVVVEGIKFAPAIWKEHLRALFLPDKWVMRKTMVVDKKTGQLRLAKRATPHRIRQSTEDLGIRGYSEHIDRCIDHAVVNWGVEFKFLAEEREAVRYCAPKAKKVQHDIAAHA